MTRPPLRHFLIVFDASQDADPRVRVFQRESAALAAYEKAESTYRSRPEIHVVLIGSDSIETVQRTHTNYWPRLMRGTPRSALLPAGVSARLPSGARRPRVRKPVGA